MRSITPTPASNELIVAEPPPLDRHPAAVYLAGLGERSRRVQRHALEVIAQTLGAPDVLTCNWAALRFQHTALIRAHLAERYAPATANRMLTALRGTLKAAWRLGLMSHEDYGRAADLGGVTGATLPAGRGMTSGEIGAIMAACENDSSAAGARDAALFGVMYVGGLRRSEVAALDLDDYDSQTGALTVLHGKGNKARVVYLTNGAARAMADWLAIRGSEAGALFWPINRAGRVARRRLTSQAIYNLLKKRGEQAGVRKFSPHDLRRTFISDLLDAGADIATVARLAGHASVTTTARYDRRPEQAKQRAAELLHLPYRGRLL